MKPIKSFAVAMAVLALSAVTSHASPLAAGSIAAPGEPDPVGATMIFTTNVNFSSSSFFGVLTSSVLTGDTSNPYGLGRLTFTYELTLNALSSDASSAISIGSFSGFLTDVSYQTPVIGLAPGLISRNPSGSQAIKFDFSSVGYLLPGANSALLVVQTDAMAWDFGVSTVFDDTGSPNVTTVVPGTMFVVPEPTSAGVFILGVGALACCQRFTKNRRS